MIFRLRVLFVSLLFSLIFSGDAKAHFGESLCERDGYHCLKVRAHRTEKYIEKNGKPKKMKRWVYIAENLRTLETREFENLPTWEILWPIAKEREIVQKLNRLNTSIRVGSVIAVPNEIQDKTSMDFSPFPYSIDPPHKKLLLWDPDLFAWAAYGPDGNLSAWGPGVGGKRWCPDVQRSCETPKGTFKILEKYGVNYRSSKYPLGECRGSEPGRPGCAPMPYFMKFHRGGFGFHGSPDVPGYHASHGCIRLFPADAEWLSKNFVEIGTEVTILPYPEL